MGRGCSHPGKSIPIPDSTLPVFSLKSKQFAYIYVFVRKFRTFVSSDAPWGAGVPGPSVPTNRWSLHVRVGTRTSRLPPYLSMLTLIFSSNYFINKYMYQHVRRVVRSRLLEGDA